MLTPLPLPLLFVLETAVDSVLNGVVLDSY